MFFLFFSFPFFVGVSLFFLSFGALAKDRQLGEFLFFRSLREENKEENKSPAVFPFPWYGPSEMEVWDVK